MTPRNLIGLQTMGLLFIFLIACQGGLVSHRYRSFKDLFFNFHLCVCMCVYVSVCPVCAGTMEGGRGCQIPGAGVTGGYGLDDVDVGYQDLVLFKGSRCY